MKKADLVEWLAWDAGVPRYAIRRVLRSFVRAVQSTLKTKGQVTLWGLGTLSTKGRYSKIIQDFEGEMIEVNMGRKVCFKPSKTLKKAARGR